MKKLTIVLLTIIAFLLGYLAGNILPLNSSSTGSTGQQKTFSLPQFGDQGIKGDVTLQVILKMEDMGNPVANVEVDLAEEPGQPPIGGTALSDENGVALFNIRPGRYFIFFNDNNFPKNLRTPEPQPIEVKSGEINKTEILMTLK